MRAWALALPLLACSRGEPAAAALGPDCAAVVAAARRATSCDPALAGLATEVERHGDEAACASAARQMLDPPAAATPSVRSVFEKPPQSERAGTPLTATERGQLDALALPAFVVITPDVAPAPGVASTAALIGELQLHADADGRLRTGVAPGARSLRLQHAGESAEYCVELKPCETLTATAHGAKLARHPAIRPGPC